MADFANLNGSESFLNETLEEHKTIEIIGWEWELENLPFMITTFILAVCIIKILFHRFHKLAGVLPESCFLIILGLLVGFAFLIPSVNKETALKFLSFNSHTFFLYLLPPIILEAAYSLKHRAFIENLGTILLYAVVGTVLNIFLVGGALVAFRYAGAIPLQTMTNLGCFVFSSIVAAVDPVAVLAIFEDVGVNPPLYYMVFGESLFNDAVTVVMYNLMIEYAEIGDVTFGSAILGTISFVLGSCCAVIVGILCGFATAWITKFTMKVKLVEPLIVFGMAFFSYLITDMFHFSGIIAIICCGLIQSHYAMENISNKSYISVHYVSKVMASIAESLIFIILGVMIVNHAGFWEAWNWDFVLLSLGLCTMARFVVTFSITYPLNKMYEGIRYISGKEQFIMCYGGLRGAIAFALAFSLEQDIVQEKNSLMCGVYFIILFTIFVQGITMKPMVDCMHIQRKSEGPRTVMEELNRGMFDKILVGIETISEQRGMPYLCASAKRISQLFLRPKVQKIPHHSHANLLKIAQGNAVQDSIFNPLNSMIGDPYLFRSESALPNVFSDELLEVCDEKRKESIAVRKSSKTNSDASSERSGSKMSDSSGFSNASSGFQSRRMSEYSVNLNRSRMTLSSFPEDDEYKKNPDAARYARSEASTPDPSRKLSVRADSMELKETQSNGSDTNV